MRTILIILITSLFWAIGLYINSNYGDEIKAEFSEWMQEEIVDEVKEEVADVKEEIAEVKAAVAPKKSAPAPTPASAPTPKVEQPKAPVKNYAELILGYWEPVEGTTSKLDISKYGTVTRYYKINNGSHWYDDRYEYAISGNKLTINRYYKCTVDLFEENGATYLEVYGHENYAGKYRKR